MAGGAGNDTLYGEEGVETMYGDAGADTFVWQAATATNMDYIMDFSTAQGDKIDLTDLLQNYQPENGHVQSDFVRLSNGTYHTIVQVDRDGAGAGNTWENVVQLQNVTGLNINTLIANGNLVI
jgi:Ca2+-binding RTX toxin-like protein